ncbi:MAG: riboflavin synthase [Chitinophagales bacterium]
MFTGIIETLGTVTRLQKEGNNLHISVESSISSSFKIDQSVAHNGICLTVVALDGNVHTVTAIHETLIKTNLEHLRVGSKVNLERSITANTRIDGHFVQGHVDTTAHCIKIEEVSGSWYFTFEYDKSVEYILVDKGSVCIDGTSLTIVESEHPTFSVAIIPYTYQHTLFGQYQISNVVNLEFDIIGKYISKLAKHYFVK